MSDEWQNIRFEDFASLQRGHDLTSSERRPGSVPVMGSAGINGYHDTALVKGPGIVIGRSGVGSMGVVSYCPVDYWPHNTTLYVTDFHGNNPLFAYYFFKMLDFRSLDTGSVQASLNRNHVHNLKIRVPHRPEQDSIADVLSALDDKIELNRRENETLEATARALFKSWFVDFDPVRAKAEGRQPFGMDAATAALFPDNFEVSALGEIPRGWEVKVLEDVLAVIETGSRPKGGIKNISEGVPSVGAESIVRIGVFDFTKTKLVSFEFHKSMKRGHVEDWDVLLYKDGGRPGEFEPHVSMFGDGFPFDSFSINEHVYRMRSQSEFMSQGFLYFWLSSDLVMEEMRIRGTGVAIPGLNSTQVRLLPALVPDSQIMRIFSEFSDLVIHRIFNNSNQNKTLAAIRDTLLPKLLSGEIRVTDAEAYIEKQ